MDRLMLLDANGLIYRAYFALFETPLTTSKGQLVNAVFGFWSIVLRGFQDVRPDYVIACFDLGKPTFRHAQFTDYKATRRPMPDDLREQFPKVRELIEAFRIPIYELEGFEADDLIGTLTLQAEGRGLETTIVSGDLDMLQLVSPATSVMTTRGGVQQTVVYDPARIDERYGLEPSQMIDFKALKGDTTDNVPGIPGVGDKTAARLLQDFRSLDGIYGDLEQVKPEKLRAKLAEYHDQVLTSRDIVTIQRELPVDLDLSNAGVGDYDRSEVLRLFREYEFRTLVERLPAAIGEAPLPPGELLRREDAHGPMPAARVPGRVPAGQGSELQLSLDFSALGGSDGGGIAVAERVTTRAVVDAVLPADPRGRLAALLADSGLAEPLEPEADLGAWLAAQPEIALGIALDDQRPRRGTLLGLAAAGADGRLVAADAEAAPRLLAAIAAADRPLVGHDIKRAFVLELARRDPLATATPGQLGALPPVALDSQIAAYVLNASLRSEPLSAIVAARLDLELPPAGLLG
ncbi:MAG TPA: 5'-3' exonuclease H3TH domain-containing protein, partial [Candidatus Limnocylindrales bacterium]|nr:5'-3' exonuclease H3TH domain-containing protein [Candidatus Limnocylindrales bacterium]